MTKRLHPARCLITGSNGRLGQLLQRGWRGFAGPAPLWMARRGAADILWSPGQPIPTLPPIGTVIALWGRTSGSAAELSQNVELVAHAEALARASGAVRVLHFSSAAIYGAGRDLDETACPAPLNPYGHAKIAMEEAIAALPRRAIRHCALRLANVVGADSLAGALAPQEAPIILDRFADGHGPRRSYVAPGDLARILHTLAALPANALPATLNVTGPVPIRMEDLARAARRPVVWRDAPDSACQEVTLDASRLAHLLPKLKLLRTAQEYIADLHRLEFTR
ncbi:MAG: NAD-dependent epimerase/dehydratase family protein [Roseovarius sp.]|nr:NAD-dependent epimerase/dehydratase family protein [Roseovarius sp.]